METRKRKAGGIFRDGLLGLRSAERAPYELLISKIERTGANSDHNLHTYCNHRQRLRRQQTNKITQRAFSFIKRNNRCGSTENDAVYCSGIAGWTDGSSY